ncbi:GAF and ANTAR domain-containing protein [Mycobacterium gordonae]|nr:GAF and ANTAR domain-containing protein [Mycobacterium sp.]MCV7009566.1 GAF and ANTAR domain-containing protein [Mycobacterium gordonae]PJE16747.1 MAG: hypothetical protein CK428_01265 [Mycobacterium sp.]
MVRGHDVGSRLLAEPEHTLSAERQSIYAVLRKVDELQRSRDPDFGTVLRDIIAMTVAAIPGAQYLGVTVFGDGGMVRTLAANHRYPSLSDAVHRDVGEGPCLSAARERRIVCIDDLATDRRWPRYRDAALERTRVRSIISFPLCGDDSAPAAFSCYAELPWAFTEESLELGLIYAAHTSLAWNVLHGQQHFHAALVSRDVIGQAKGILMERFQISAAAAFSMLRQLSQESNTKLVHIAEKVIQLERAGQASREAPSGCQCRNVSCGERP